MSNKIAIFGAGLSAMYIYAACLDLGYAADFFTLATFSKSKTSLIGPIRLAWVPERVHIQPEPVWFFSLGNKIDYLEKMKRNTKKISETAFPETGRRELQAYNPIKFLNNLQPEKSCKITIGKFTDTDILEISKQYVHTFVTFPLQSSLQTNKKVFYWIYMLRNAATLSMPNLVIYNATDYFPWTRFTQYWGTYMWEYSHSEYLNKLPPKPNILAEAIKISDICSGTQNFKSPFSAVTMVGRWARWNKKVLAHHAYKQATKILKEL